jgi:hypothetical protein
MTYTIKTPNPEFNGTRAGLIFEAGQATTTDRAIAEYCQYALGYHVEPDPADPPPADPPATTPTTKPNRRK